MEHTWTWKKITEEDGNPGWKGVRSDGLDAAIWLSGGNAGEYLTEGAGRHPTLAAAKAAVKKFWSEA